MGEKSEVIIELFGIFDVTGEVVTMWIILGLLTVVSLIVKLNLKERPGKFQNIVETGVEYLDKFFTDILGKKKARKYFTFLASLFIFIISNVLYCLCSLCYPCLFLMNSSSPHLLRSDFTVTFSVKKW